MKRETIAQVWGFAGLGLIILGAILYGINSPHRSLALGSLVAGLLLFAGFVILSIENVKAFARRRASRYGANMVIMIVLFTCIMAIIQTLSVRHARRFDLTKNKRFSLAPQTTKLLDHLDKDVQIYAFYKKGSPGRRKAEDLIAQYAFKSKRIHYEFVDPDHKPQLAREMGITSYGTTVVKCVPKKELITDLTEEKLTNALVKVTRELAKAIYFVGGHGEKDPSSREAHGLSILKEEIEKQNYLVKKLSLFEVESVPSDCYLLVVAGPSKDFFQGEIDKIKAYLDQGRNALFMIEPRTDLPNLAKLVGGYGIELDNDVIIDPISRLFGGDYTVPVVTNYERHPITKGFNVASFFPTARSVRLAEKDDLKLTTQYLAKTGKSAWGETDLERYARGQASRDPVDISPPVSIAAIASREVEVPDTSGAGGTKRLESKIVVIGDSDFADNSSFRVSGNADFLMNTVNFLAEEKDLVAIRPKQGLGDRLFLTASQGRLIFLLCVIVLPLGIITFGTSLFIRRRKRG